MKAYSQLLKGLPSKKVVFAFGRFQPPTIGHELLVKAVTKLAATHNAAHVIYASRTTDKTKNPLPVDRKVYYLKRMFSGATFAAAGPTTRTFIEAAKELNKKYKDIIMVAGSDRVADFKRLLEQYNGKEFNFDSIQVISAGERDPDGDDASGMSGTKMRDAAKKGNFATFKKGLPSSLTTADGRRLMNEIRDGLGLNPVKEEIVLSKDWLRESYFRGEIFKIGQFVECKGEQYEILDRGSNYLTLVDSTGSTSRKWIQDVTLLGEDYNPPNPSDEEDDLELSFKGYHTQNFNVDKQVLAAFQRLTTLPDKDPTAILNAIKATDTYLGIHQKAIDEDSISTQDLQTFGDSIQRAQEFLIKLNDLQHHSDYINNAVHEINQVQSEYHKSVFDDAFGESLLNFKELSEMKFSSSDKIKVARIIADALGVPDVEKNSSPEQLINNALRKVRNKPMRPEYATILKHMLQTAREAGIEYDVKMVPAHVNEAKKEASYGGDYQDMVKRVGERAKQGPMKTVWVPHEHGTGGRYKVVPVDHKQVKEEIQEDKQKDEIATSDYKPVAAGKKDVKARRNTIVFDQAKGIVKEDAVDRPDLGITPTGKMTYDAIKRFLGVQDELKHGGEDPTEYEADNVKDTESDFDSQFDTKDHQGQYKTDQMTSLDRMRYHYRNEEIELDFEEELLNMNDVEHIIEAYDDEEFIIIDEETGEELDTTGFESSLQEGTIKESQLLILEISRMERIRRKQRFARTQSKREVRVKLALNRTSNQSTINKRSRKLAISMIKKRMLRKDPSLATTQEKERVEKFIQSRKEIVDRLARRVAPRVRQIEKNRLQGKKAKK